MSAVSKSIAILGTRGLPATYSGFETSVEETASRFVARGHRARVYCRSHHYSTRAETHRGAELVFLPSIKTKHLDTFSHTLLSVLHVLFHRCDAVILYGLGNAAFIPLLRLFSIPVIAVLDGADWRRGKWGRLARLFLKGSRRIAVRSASRYVVDNRRLAEEYRRELGGDPVHIPYGAKLRTPVDPSVLERYGLTRRDYVIFVGRFVKEKNVEMLIESYMRLETSKKLVVVGGNPLDADYERRIRAMGDSRILFTGMVYGSDYESLLSEALFYVSCSGLEGTSPSLLSAMALNGFALVADIEENRETLRGSCATFAVDDGRELRERLAYYLSRPDEVDRARNETKRIVERHYDWERIAERYLEIIDGLREARARSPFPENQEN